MSETYPRVSHREEMLIREHLPRMVNTGAGPDDPSHALDLLNSFRRENNRDLTVNVVRYLLGFGIDCQVRLLTNLTSSDIEVISADGVVITSTGDGS